MNRHGRSLKESMKSAVYLDRRPVRASLRSIIGWGIPVLFSTTLAAAEPMSQCDRAAHGAAADSIVPVEVLLTLTRLETGRSRNGLYAPWPWTINLRGTGTWFQTKAEALTYIRHHLDAGVQDFDVGCFQINYKWHNAGFRSLEDMFDPEKNAQYAAGFLARLYSEFGNWDAAIGAYHSRTEALAAKYLKRYARIQHQLPPHVVAPDDLAQGWLQPRRGLFDQAGAHDRVGFLAPGNASTSPFIGLN